MHLGDRHILLPIEREREKAFLRDGTTGARGVVKKRGKIDMTVGNHEIPEKE